MAQQRELKRLLEIIPMPSKKVPIVPAPDVSAVFSAETLVATLPMQIADKIVEAIVEERFEPGQHLREVELAKAFGVSRASVREALRIAESRGLVQILPQRGAQVSLLSREELEHLFEIRAVLLGLAGRWVAARYNEGMRAPLQAGVAALAAARSDTSAYVSASARMVECVAQLSGSEELAELMSSIAQRIGRYTRLGLATDQRRQQSLSSWRKCLRAFAAKDEATTEAILRAQALENRDASLREIVRRDLLRAK